MSESTSPISLIAAFYRNETDAGEMLAQLKQMDKDGTVDIIDAAVMVKAEDGRKLKVNETAELTAKKGGLRGALVGGALGIIFPPSILAMAAVGAAAGAALGHFTDQGFDNNLLKEIGENLPPGAPPSSPWSKSCGSSSFRLRLRATSTSPDTPWTRRRPPDWPRRSKNSGRRSRHL